MSAQFFSNRMGREEKLGFLAPNDLGLSRRLLFREKRNPLDRIKGAIISIWRWIAFIYVLLSFAIIPHWRDPGLASSSKQSYFYSISGNLMSFFYPLAQRPVISFSIYLSAISSHQYQPIAFLFSLHMLDSYCILRTEFWDLVLKKEQNLWLNF